jgi:hypothetical protein
LAKLDEFAFVRAIHDQVTKARASIRIASTETYSSCAHGVAVSLCSLPGVDHVLYQNAAGLSVPMVAWALFQKHPRK